MKSPDLDGLTFFMNTLAEKTRLHVAVARQQLSRPVVFRELHPLIQNRSLTITVAALGGGRIRVNVIPRALESDTKINDKIGYSNKDRIAKVPDATIGALTTPLSLTGTPEEIDAQLPQALTQFAESHGKLQKTLEDAKEQIAAAVREIQDREKSKSKSTSSGKRDEPTVKPAARTELLPLWVSQPSDTAVANGANSAAPGSETTAPTQLALHSAQEEVTKICQSQ